MAVKPLGFVQRLVNRFHPAEGRPLALAYKLRNQPNMTAEVHGEIEEALEAMFQAYQAYDEQVEAASQLVRESLSGSDCTIADPADTLLRKLIEMAEGGREMSWRGWRETRYSLEAFQEMTRLMVTPGKKGKVTA